MGSLPFRNRYDGQAQACHLPNYYTTSAQGVDSLYGHYRLYSKGVGVLWSGLLCVDDTRLGL